MSKQESMSSRQSIPAVVSTSQSLLDRVHARQRRRDAFMALTIGLRCRPQPRWRWDRVASGEINDPSESVVQCAHAIALAGGSRAHVEQWLDVIRADALSAFPEPERPSPDTTHLVFMKETTEAIHAVSVADKQRCPASIARACIEVREAISAALVWLGSHLGGLPVAQRRAL